MPRISGQQTQLQGFAKSDLHSCKVNTKQVTSLRRSSWDTRTVEGTEQWVTVALAQSSCAKSLQQTLVRFVPELLDSNRSCVITHYLQTNKKP